MPSLTGVLKGDIAERPIGDVQFLSFAFPFSFTARLHRPFGLYLEVRYGRFYKRRFEFAAKTIRGII